MKRRDFMMAGAAGASSLVLGSAAASAHNHGAMPKPGGKSLVDECSIGQLGPILGLGISVPMFELEFFPMTGVTSSF